MGWKNYLYISSQTITNTNGIDVSTYGEPKKYFFNIQFASGTADITEYGTRISNIKKAIVDISFKNKIKEGDIAYLDGVKPNTTKTNYNYKVTSVREQNQRIAIYFEKIVK